MTSRATTSRVAAAASARTAVLAGCDDRLQVQAQHSGAERGAVYFRVARDIQSATLTRAGAGRTITLPAKALMARIATGVLLAAITIGAAAGCSGAADEADTAPAPPERTQVSVPDLVGLDPERAVARLCAAGLSISAVEVVERTPAVGPRPAAALPASKVRAVEPAPGKRVPVGQALVLRLSVPENAGALLPSRC